MRRLCVTLALFAVTACLGLVVAPAGAAEFHCEPPGEAFGLCNFDITFTGPEGETLTQAGAHPFAMTTSFEVTGKATGKGGVFLNQAVKDVLVTLMPGFAGAPEAVPPCSEADFLTERVVEFSKISSCPDASAVGVVANQLASELNQTPAYSAVYNLRHSPGKAAKLGFWTGNVPITIDVEVGEGTPNPIVAGPTDIPQLVEVLGTEFTLWGVPADPRHDPLRGSCMGETGKSTGECPAPLTQTPFLTMPRACDGPLASSYFARSWLGATEVGKAFTHDEAGNPQGMTGCGSLPFAPSISAQPTSRSAASASGMDVSLHIDDPGLTNPSEEARAGSDIREAVLAFPEGVTINPSQAEGLVACSEGQAHAETAGSAFGAGCPAESKIGSVEVESPLLPGEVFNGSIFVATPYENPFGSLIALYMTIKSAGRGVSITLPGKVEADPTTGRILTSFGTDGQQLPQLPISNLHVHLNEGAHSPLITPSHCGDYTTQMTLTPSGDPAHPFTATSDFHIGSGVGGGPCPAAGAPPFEPGFSAGTLSNGAATYSPFLMRLTRRDGDQDLTKFAATLPPGVLASLVGVSKCSDSAIAAARARTGPHGGAEESASPSCPPNSKVGTTEAGAGVGQELVYVPGSLYLAGPYNGAPLSVVAITPGVAGPFDVGTVVVRVALNFDPLTGEVTADGSRSDPIPHILHGIPLAVRELQVNVDRHDWIFNPTSCRKSSTRATLFGSGADFFNPADDVGVGRSASFRAADCTVLGFSPRLGLRLRGGASRGDSPALTATYVPRPGDANLRSLALLFPRSEFIENAHFRTICTRVAYAAKNCPKGSVYGHATVTTPLLEEPLTGPVYLRSSDHLLPDAVLSLHGIVDIEVPIKIDSHKKRLRATVLAAPDAPVTKAVVHMQGGEKGLFVNSKPLCARKNRANITFGAQSGKSLKRRPLLRVAGCHSKRKHKHKRR